MNSNKTAGDSNGLLSSVTSGLTPSTIAGLVLVPLGAWCALEPFILGTWAWHWDFTRFLLAVLPGGLAVLGGLIMLGGRRPLVYAGGTLALASGVWFVVGPVAYSLWSPAELGTVPGGGSIRLLQWMPFFFGAGSLISVLSAYGLGLIAPLQFADDQWAEPAGVAASESVASESVASDRPRSRRVRERSHVRDKRLAGRDA